MTVIGEAFIDVKPRTEGFERDTVNRVKSVAKKAALVFGSAFAVTKGIDFLGGSIAEAREAEKVGKDTAAAIKSTGGAANVTSGQIADLSQRISEKIGKDDEMIQSSANVLLTFTKVRNEVGKGNDIFSQATTIAQDMAARLGGDASGAALQLGKALNDPIKGLTTLGRAGVSFTAKQKDTIKGLVESGNVLGAQKVILKELNTEFAGSAAAQADSGDKLKVVYDNLRESLGTRLLPLFTVAATIAARVLPKAFDFLGAAVDRITPFIERVISNVRLFVNAFRTGFTEDEGTPIERLALRFREFIPVVQRVVAFLQRNLKPILIGIGVAFLALTSPITAIVGGLIFAYARFKAFRDVVSTVIDVVRAVAEAVGQFVQDNRAQFEQWGAAMAEIFSTAFTAIRAVVELVLGIISEAWDRFGSHIVAFIASAWENVKLVISGALQVIQGVLDVFAGIFTGDWSRIWEGIKEIFAGVWRAMRGVVGQLLNEIRTIIAVGMGVISQIWAAIWHGIQTFLSDVWEGIKGIVTGAFRFLVNLALNWTIAGQIIKHFDDIKRGVRNAIDAVVGFVAGLPGRIAGFLGKLASVGRSIGGAIVGGITDGLAGVLHGALDLGGALLSAFKSAWNSLVGFINTAWNKMEVQMPFPPHKTLGLPNDIPNKFLRLDTGGVITGDRALVDAMRGEMFTVPGQLAPVLAKALDGLRRDPGDVTLRLLIEHDGRVTEIVGTADELSGREITVLGRAV